jgi:uncharacterized protein
MLQSWISIALIFVLAGMVKGVTGMGLPTVSMGVLGLLMAPSEAAALLIIPSFITNVWQFAAGPNRLLMLRRMWPMLLAVGIATWACAGLLSGGKTATAALGVALIAYAAVGLGKLQVSVARSAEPWLSPLIGATTGVITGATGVFVIPAVPYLQALGLDKDDLVQALGLSFTVSTIALAAGLASRGGFHGDAGVVSLLCTVPALAGMQAGQWIRNRVNPATFRLCFFIGLLLLGADLAARPLT